jgi:hypothetical protein
VSAGPISAGSGSAGPAWSAGSESAWSASTKSGFRKQLPIGPISEITTRSAPTGPASTGPEPSE